MNLHARCKRDAVHNHIIAVGFISYFLSYCSPSPDVAELLYSFADADGMQALAVHWEPPPEYAYKWKHKLPVKPKSLRIYECHVGISGQEPKISSFSDFISKVTTLYFVLQFVLTSKLFNFHSSKSC